MNSKLQGMLGLCIRSGKVSLGYDGVKKSVKTHKARMVLLADNASERSKKDVADMCRHYNIQMICDDFSDVFYQLTSKDKLKVISVNDDSFAGEILKITSGTNLYRNT